jgi:sulfotransferase
MPVIFFQSSMPRSGSTLLQNIIAQRPDFYVTPTSGLLELLIGARGNYTTSPEFKAQDSDLMREAFQSFCLQGMNGYFSAITDKPYVIDKSRGWGIHYDFLNGFYPYPKIVCMVRDLRDIFASMEKKFRANPDKADPILDWVTGRGTTTPKRIDAWLASPPVGLAIERLTEITRQGLDKHIHFVRYEDLTMRPQQTMTLIYEYFGINDYYHDFDNVEQVTIEDDAVYGQYGDHNIRQKVMPMKSDADRILGKDVTGWILQNFEWYFKKFGYAK